MGEIAKNNRVEAFGLTLDGHKKQEDTVLELVTKLNEQGIYPDAHYLQTHLPRTPLTSIRRALSNLCNRDKKIEEHGKCYNVINNIRAASTTYKVVLQMGLF